MATEQPPDQLSLDHPPAVVKEEPPEEELEISTFCFETVTKEEVILEDTEEHTDDQPELERVPPLVIFNKRPFKCPECNRTFDKLYNLNRCAQRHNAIRLGLFKCKVCGKCSGTKKDNFKHEGIHEKASKQSQSVEDNPGTEQGTSGKDPLQKENSLVDRIETEDVIEEDKSEEINQCKNGNLPESSIKKAVNENVHIKCSECDRTYKHQKMADECTKRHLARRLGFYPCKFCSKRFGTCSNLRKHERRHKPNTEHPEESKSSTLDSVTVAKEHAFQCSMCNKSFDKLKDFKRCELRCRAFNSERYKCNICGKCYSSSSNLTRHKHSHEPGKVSTKSFKCSECDRTFNERFKANRCKKIHMARRLGLHQCKFCNFRMGTPGELRRHELTHKSNVEQLQSVEAVLPEPEQPAPVSAEVIEGDVLSKTPDAQHTEISKERPFKCLECKKTFAQLKKLIKCEWKHKVIKLGRYKCKECGKCCASKNHLTLHAGSHGLFKCYECNRSYKTQRMVTQCTNKHLKQRLGLHQCKLCNWRAVSQSELRKHEQTHQLITEHAALPRPFQCDLCKMCFPAKSGIRKHMKRHITTEPRFKCQRCDEKFATIGERISHALRHDWDETKYKYYKKLVVDSDGNYLCTICNKKFIKKQSMAITHVFKHMNVIEGLFKCQMCGMKCQDKHSYKKHVQTHENSEEVLDSSSVKTPSQTADKSNKETDGNSSSFCYETITKEELIIDDEEFGDSAENEQDANSHNSLGEIHSTQDGSRSQQDQESRESMNIQSERTEGEGTTQLNDAESHDKHKKLHDPSRNPIECQTCHEKFDDLYSFTKHNRIHQKVIKAQFEELVVKEDDGAKYTCSLCELSFRIRLKALGHVQRHMTVIKGIFQCKICGLRCGGNAEYQAHVKIHQNTPDEMASPRMRAGTHIDYESSSEVPCEKSNLQLHCKTCDVFFNNKTNFNIHLWKSRLKITQSKIIASGREISEFPQFVADENGFFNCSKCDFKTNKRNLFKIHERHHEGVYTCDVCQLDCESKKHLLSHKESHKKFRFMCLRCKMTFETRSKLMKHINKHKQKR